MKEQGGRTDGSNRPLVLLWLGLGAIILGFSPAASATSSEPMPWFDFASFQGRLIIDMTTGVGSSAVGQEDVLSAMATAAGADTDQNDLEPHSQANPAFLGLNSQTPSGQIRLCFNSSVPQPVRREALSAAARWDETLDLRGPQIEIDIYWLELGDPVILGAAGPTVFVQDSELPRPEARYPVALANELLGLDHTPRNECDSSEPGEIVLVLNATAGSDSGGWIIGEEPLGDAPFLEEAIDLQTTLLHEFGHGLGFIGSAELDEDGNLAWPSDADTPMIYDLFSRRCTVERLVGCAQEDSTPVEVGDLGATLSSKLWFDTILGPLVELEAPFEWDEGSSFSHLDEYRYPPGSPFALMTPYIEAELRVRSVDRATSAVMQAIGWSLEEAPITLTLDWVRSGDNRIQLAVKPVELREGVPPTSFKIRVLKVVSDPFGNLGRRLAYEPLLALSRQVSIEGIENGVLYEIEIRTEDTIGEGLTRSRPLLLLETGAGEGRVQGVYSRLLGREPTQEEMDNFVRLSRSGDLGDAIVEVFDSPETREKEAIARLYLGLLDRVPDPEGLAFWVDRLQIGIGLQTVASEFLATTRSELGPFPDDESFIEFIYRAILGRSPEPAGHRYWMQRLASGDMRGRILVEVSESDEHRQAQSVLPRLVVASNSWLGRSPSTDEQQLWSSVLDNGGLGDYLAALEVGAVEVLVSPARP